MSYDPLSQVTDEPLFVNEALLGQLALYRASPKLALLPGVDPPACEGHIAKHLAKGFPEPQAFLPTYLSGDSRDTEKELNDRFQGSVTSA